MATGPRGREVLLDVLESEGVRHIFGNPGTTELPLMDALASRTDPAYVLALQEATAVAMADGYAQITDRPAFLNLHTSAGLGNAIGNLTNARANGTPLVVTAGQQDRRHRVHDPLLAGDLVNLAAPVSKWAIEVGTGDQLGILMRRAFHDAAAPPRGPVFVSIPMDILEEPAAPAPPPSDLRRNPRADDPSLEELADRLVAAERPALVVGDEVTAARAVELVAALAEALGCPVHGSPLYSTGLFPTAHDLWAGALPPAATAINAALSVYDTVLLLGDQAFLVYPYTPGSPVPDGLDVLHLAPDPAALARTHPVALGIAGDLGTSVAALLARVSERVGDGRAGRVSAARDRRAADVARLEQTATARYGEVPAHAMAAAHALVRAVPADTLVVDEAITTGTYVRGFHHTTRPGRYFFCKGGGLGWGMPAACGVSLGAGREPVLCVVGDGSAMYSPQALWTAARERLPVVFAVVNNRQYLILKNNLRQMKGDTVETGRFVAMDLDDPPVDYVSLARSMGVASSMVEKPDDVGDAVRAALDAGVPHLIEIPIAAP